MKLLGPTLLCQRKIVETVGRFHLPEKNQLDHWLNAPNEYLVLEKSSAPVKDARLAELLTHIQPGDRVICYSDYRGPEELGNGRVVLTVDQVIAVMPKAAAS